MAEVQPRNVLLRVGGRTLRRYGVLAVGSGGIGRIEELKEAFARADATICASEIDRGGAIRIAGPNERRVDWVDLDGDGIRETPVPILEGARIQGWQFTEDLTNAVWAKVNCTISANADGVADGIVTNNGTFNANVGQLTGALTDSTQQSTFFEVKPGNKTWARISTTDKAGVARSSWINLATGALGTKDASHNILVKAVGAYWRIMVMWPSATGATAPIAYICPAEADNTQTTVGDGATINVYVRDAQMEVDKAFPSSYIQRPGAGAITRATDSMTLQVPWGPFDMTVLAIVLRPTWADAVGSIGGGSLFPGVFDLGDNVSSLLRLYAQDATRTWTADITSGASAASLAIPVGAQQTLCAQYKNLTSGGQVRLDVGSGFGAFGTAAAAFSAYGGQMLRIGGVLANASPLYGGLIDLIFARGLFSLAEMLAIPT